MTGDKPWGHSIPVNYMRATLFRPLLSLIVAFYIHVMINSDTENKTKWWYPVKFLR